MQSFLISALANGLILGIIYGLLGLSLTIIYGVMRISNLAHGEIVVAGSFVTLYITSNLHLSPLAALPIAFVLLAAFGFVIYTIAGKRLQNSSDPELASFLFFYGVSLMLGATFLYLFEADVRSINYQFKPASFEVGTLTFSHARVLASLTAMVLVPVIFYLLYRTIYGKALRAAVMNRDALRIVGIDVDKLSLITFSICVGVAGVTGVLMALVFPAFSPFSGQDFTITSFIVIVLGGLGNPFGAILGGVLFAVTEQLTTLYFGQSVSLIAGFLILVIVVVFRPAGLVGRIEWRA